MYDGHGKSVQACTGEGLQAHCRAELRHGGEDVLLLYRRVHHSLPDRGSAIDHSTAASDPEDTDREGRGEG